MEAAVASAFKLSGQRCVSSGRMIVQRTIYDEFAKKFDLPIVQVVSGGDISSEAFTDTETGTMMNSATSDGSFSINGLSVKEAIEKTIKYLENIEKG